MEEASIKKLTESDIVFPNDFESTICALNIKRGIMNIFFDSDHTSTIRQIAEVQEKLRKIRKQIDMMKQANQNIHVEILFMIDTRFNDWLKECARYSEEGHDIDHGLIDFNDIIRSISRRSFISCPLPSNFRKLASATDDDATPKKRKTENEKDNKDGRDNKV